MEKYESIERGILQNDITVLRESIGNICYTCSDFSNSEFDEVVEYVCGKGIKLMDKELVGELISADKTIYTDEDFAKAVFLLKKNFCQERIDDVKKIGKTLYRKKAESNNPSTQSAGTSPNVRCHQVSKKAKLKAAGLVAVVAAIAVVTIIFVLLMKK